LYLDDYQYNYSYPQAANTSVKEQKMTFLFTDRSIYRPGQTIHFKGIMVSRNTQTRETTIIPNFATSISLSDVNGQQVDSIAVTTNEYGAYSVK
jgi:uncharacterized protein YfaS (alpha-2-macroglobulin family)